MVAGARTALQIEFGRTCSRIKLFAIVHIYQQQHIPNVLFKWCRPRLQRGCYEDLLLGALLAYYFASQPPDFISPADEVLSNGRKRE